MVERATEGDSSLRMICPRVAGARSFCCVGAGVILRRLRTEDQGQFAFHLGGILTSILKHTHVVNVFAA